MLTHKYYIDELYHALVTKPLDAISSFTYKYFEVGLIDGLVNGTGKALTGFSGLLRFSQTGNIGGYIFSMVIGIILILVFTLIV
jgi:NADH-quinone oxidoreductase subunit L